MSSETGLEAGEDLDTVALVRLEDVQPKRDNNNEGLEVLETCIVDTDEYGTECVLDDDDSNIGSMVSIQSEEVVLCEDESELIVPEMLDTETVDINDIEESEEKSPTKTNAPDSWPTLEILPGGVIKNADKEDLSSMFPSLEPRKLKMSEKGDMMYACAKCSQGFKYLFCLVKHVRWHEDEEKKRRGVVQKPKRNTAKDLKEVKGKPYILTTGKRKIHKPGRGRRVPKKS